MPMPRCQLPACAKEPFSLAVAVIPIDGDRYLMACVDHFYEWFDNPQRGTPMWFRLQPGGHSYWELPFPRPVHSRAESGQ
jgi:hypothetical protein